MKKIKERGKREGSHLLIWSPTAAVNSTFTQEPLKGTQGLIRPLVPGFQVTLMSRCFIGTETLPPFSTRCVCTFGLVRALQIADGCQECFMQRACDSLQIGRLQVLNRGLHLDFEVLHAVAEIGRNLVDTK